MYLIIKSLHIIFVVSYFAGIFYIVRLLIYHTEALQGKSEPERGILHRQYSFMEERLWNIITVPALVIVVLTGAYMLWATQWAYLLQGWMHIKLLGVVLLLVYHYWSWRTLRELQQGAPAIAQWSYVWLMRWLPCCSLLLFLLWYSGAYSLVTGGATLLSFVAMGALIMAVVKIVNRKRWLMINDIITYSNPPNS